MSNYLWVKDNKSVIGFIILMIGVAAFGTYIWFGLDSALDYNIIIQQIATNQTFVDSLNCDEIQRSLNTLNNIYSPSQQDEVIQLRSDFERIKIMKECG